MATTLKEQAVQKAVRAIVRLLPRISEENLLRLVTLGRRLTDDPEVLQAIDTVRTLLQVPEHPANRLFHRVLTYLPPERRIRLFETLFNGAWFKGGKLRDEWEAKLGFRPPFIMILSPTLHCNLRCKGCYTLGYGTKPQLPLEVADGLLTQCEELGIFFVTILGGEPLVYPHLFTLLERHPEVFFQVYTNGTLMTKEKAQRFADLANAAVVISIEGGEKETDSWRGKGVYKKILKAFEYLNNSRVIIGTSATVTRDNVYKVASEEFIDQMITLGSMAQMYFLYIPVNGQADFSLMVSPEERDHLRRQVLKIRGERPLFILDFWNDGPYVDGCIAGARRYFHVNAKGDVEPCVYTHVAMDNITKTPLVEALDSPLFRRIRACQPHNSNHLRPCMIIDNPQVMREMSRLDRVYFTHPGAEEIYTLHKARMDEYAARWGAFADQIWQEEYMKDSPQSEKVQIPGQELHCMN